MEANYKKIFIVDDNVTNLKAARNVLKSYYEVFPARSAAVLFDMLERVMADVILLDIAMPEVDGYEALRRLKGDQRFKEIPVIFLTAKGDEGSELQGFDLGAADYISKPFSPPLLKKRIENQLLILRQKEMIRKHSDDLGTLLNEKNREIFELQNAILRTARDLVEFRDNFTGGHTSNTVKYIEVLIHSIIEKGVYSQTTINWNMDFILPSVQLHDVGKIAVSDTVLKKSPELLSPHELELLKSHVEIGGKVVKRIMANIPEHAFLYHALHLVETHHERWDGTGYPKGLKGEEIPLEGRLMAIVNAYDTLVSWRPYQKAFSHDEAVENIVKGSGSRFDPVLVDVFLGVADKFKQIQEKMNQEKPVPIQASGRV